MRASRTPQASGSVFTGERFHQRNICGQIPDTLSPSCPFPRPHPLGVTDNHNPALVIRSMQPDPRHLLAAALLAPLALIAQPASPPSVPPPSEVLVLSAFEVRSAKDSGYRVQNSVATTGVAQALMDTPLPITVITGMRSPHRVGELDRAGRDSPKKQCVEVPCG